MSRNSPFGLLLKDESRRKTLMVLLENNYFWLNVDIVSKYGNIDKEKVKKSVNEFEKLEIIEYNTDKIGFRLNENADAVKELIAVNREIHNYTNTFSELFDDN